MPSVLTIILNYKTARMTLVATEFALRAMEGLDGEILIVDNDSQDGSFETMSAAVEAKGWTAGNRVRVVASGHNGGFGAGVNFGIKTGLSDGGKPDYYYLLNSDAEPDENAVKVLVSFLETNTKAAFAGSALHGADGVPHRSAFRFPSVWSELEGAARLGPISRLLEEHIVAIPIPATTTQVDWVAGASFLMRRKAIDEIGVFDETFFLYFEETDLCRRAAKAGWTCWYVPESSVLHIGSVSTGMGKWKRTPRYWFDSRMHYFAKQHGRGYAVLATTAHIAGGLIWRARLLVQRKAPADPPHFLSDMAAHAFEALFRTPQRALGAASPHR